MPNPKVTVKLAEPLTERDTPEALLSALRAGIQEDKAAAARLDRARAQRDRWLKTAQTAKISWPTMLDASGMSRGMLARILKADIEPHAERAEDDTLEAVRSSSAEFWEAKQHRDDTRAGRNELVCRAYMGGVPTAEIADEIGSHEQTVYDIIHGKFSKQVRKY